MFDINDRQSYFSPSAEV